MRIVITAAAGRIGRAMIEELSACHELRLLDRAPMGDRRARVVGRAPRRDRWRARLWPPARRAGWTDAFGGADVVLHLAAEANSTAPWEEVLNDNVNATWNVSLAAAAHGVRRMVLASSPWAVKAVERALAPACYVPHGPKIGSDAPPRPLTPTGFPRRSGSRWGGRSSTRRA